LAALLPAPRPGGDDALAGALAAPVADLLEILTALWLRGDEARRGDRALRGLGQRGGPPRRLAEPVADLLEILTGLGLRGDEAIHVVRALRSSLHGFTDLERRGGFRPRHTGE